LQLSTGNRKIGEKVLIDLVGSGIKIVFTEISASPNTCQTLTAFFCFAHAYSSAAHLVATLRVVRKEEREGHEKNCTLY
jgi:hypothetical protein